MKLPLPPIYGRIFFVVLFVTVGLLGCWMTYLRFTGSPFPNVLTGQTEEFPLVSSHGGVRYGTLYVREGELWLCWVLGFPLLLGMLAIPIGAVLVVKDWLRSRRERLK